MYKCKIVSRNSCLCSTTLHIKSSIFRRFAQYNQQVATFLNLCISVRRCTCFRRFFRPLAGAQNCTSSVRYLSDRYCYLLLARLAAGSNIGVQVEKELLNLHAGRSLTENTVPDAVLIQFDLLMITELLETCRGL